MTELRSKLVTIWRRMATQDGKTSDCGYYISGTNERISLILGSASPKNASLYY